MARRSEREVKPRNGHTLRVLIVSRISGCANQKEASLDDQEDNAEEIVRELYDGPVEFRRISTKGKGERLDRPELEEIEAAYESGDYDLVVYDDLSRLIRGGEAARLLGVGVDNGTRSICIEDGIDTEDGTWEEDALNACSENVAHQERTSKRIKKKNMNRFKKYGRPTGRPIAGYGVPEGAKSYDDWLKNEDWTDTIREGAELLRRTLDCSIVADNFNAQGFPVGPYVSREDWVGYLVRSFYGNSLLKGYPQRGKMHTVKHHGTGRRRSVKNPKGPNYYHAPHLAFLDVEEFDSLNELLDAKNAGFGRPSTNGEPTSPRRSRNDSRFPGQVARCWYCGFPYVWGGNGVKENLMCNNARHWHCWHSIGFSGPLAAQKVVAEICRQLTSLDGLDDQFSEMVKGAGNDLGNQVEDQWRNLRRDETAHAKHRQNLLNTIKEFGPQDFLKDEMENLKAEGAKLLLRRHQLEHHRPNRLELPPSVDELRQLLEEEFGRLANDARPFKQLLQRIVPEWYNCAVRLCDGGHLLPRARITLNLAGNYPDVNLVPGLHELLTREVTLDLFEPPQREVIRVEAVRLAATGLGPKAIAQAITANPAIDTNPTGTAVHNALALQRQMEALGIDTPYVMLLAPPKDYPKVRRHKHPRYDFRPLDGYDRPEL